MAVLKINGLSKSFGIKTVFENVSFEVRSGERIGLVGANGAGKTTLLRCLMGQEDYDKGSVSTSPGAVIGYLRQDFNYIPVSKPVYSTSCASVEKRYLKPFFR